MGLTAVDSHMGKSEGEGPTVGESLPTPSVGLLSRGGETGKQISDSQLGGHKQGTPGALTPEQMNCSGIQGLQKPLLGVTLELCL